MSVQYAINIFSSPKQKNRRRFYHLVRDGRSLCGLVCTTSAYQVSTQPWETRDLCPRCAGSERRP